MNVVFVCTGNTCRSPMAEGIFRVLLKERGITDCTCQSCGISTFTGMPATDNAVAAAKRYGADLSAHRSKPLSQYLVDTGDLFVCMTKEHACVLQNFVPAEKIRILGDGIPDPFQGDIDVYNACADAIDRGLMDLLEKEDFS